MNRNRAKLLTITGVICFLISITLIVANLVGEWDFPIFIAPLLFVGGIALIVSSLAYYTER